MVDPTEAELVANLGNLTASELHLDKLGTGKGLAVRSLQRSDSFLGAGIENVRGVAISEGSVPS